MLEPQDRRQLIDALRPPPGYGLDVAVGTTFSLDLIALLTTPLAFTQFDMERQNDTSEPDPLALMESLRRYAGRISVFCQAGRINIPKHTRFLSYIEDTVVEVAVPQGVFHPKVWAIRFVSDDEPVIYRILSLSRNLTFDNSWDTMVILEGELSERKVPIAKNRPLAEFFAALPSLAVRSVPDRINADINRIQEELGRVQFAIPASFNDVKFWPLGIGSGRNWPFPRDARRTLLISPFISSTVIRRLTTGTSNNILISRTEAIDALPDYQELNLQSLFVLSPNAEPEEDDSASNDESPVAESADQGTVLSGLHAKVFIIETDKDVSIFAGSANATNAAFNGNVEFLVELTGERSKHGIDSLLKKGQGETSLMDLLKDYTPPAEPVQDNSSEALLYERLDTACTMICGASISADIARAPGREEFSLRLALGSGTILNLPDGVTAGCRPVTLQESANLALPAEVSGGITFAPISFEALTTFIVVDLKAVGGTEQRLTSFVMNIPSTGMPDDRQHRILLSLLEDKEKVLQFLLLLLSDDRFDPSVFLSGNSDDNIRTTSVFGGMGDSLFEPLVKAFERSPEKIDHIATLMTDLCKTDMGRALLPDRFMEIWEPIWQARQETTGVILLPTDQQLPQTFVEEITEVTITHEAKDPEPPPVSIWKVIDQDMI